MAAYIGVHVAPHNCSGDVSGAMVTVYDASNNVIYGPTATGSTGWVSWNAQGFANGNYHAIATLTGFNPGQVNFTYTCCGDYDAYVCMGLAVK